MSLTHRALSTASLTLLLLAAMTAQARADDGHATKSSPHATAAPTPEEAKARLVAGNDRFVHGLSTQPHQDKKRLVAMGAAQHPFVTVLSCSDSHAPPEIVFDQGLGDVISVRVAGNVVDADQAGSVEYGLEHLETPLLVVMGHTKCGAVIAAATHAVVHGHVSTLVAKVGPAVEAVRAKAHGGGDAELVQEAVRANVFHSMAALMRSSDVVRERVHGGKTQMVGAVYDVGTGSIEWLGRHPDEAKLVSSEAKSEAAEHHGGDAKKGAGEHGSAHGAEAKKGAGEHGASHGTDPEVTAGGPEHGAPVPAPPPNLPVAFAIVTLAATIGGAISGRLSRS